MKQISKLELNLRTAALRSAFPVALAAANRAAKLAPTRVRRSFAIQRHVAGSGIEVGAAATPAVVPLGATVRYVDKYDLTTLMSDPELAGLSVRAPDIIASAEKLEGILDASQDFVLAFSLLEHVQDALGTIASFHRVTRGGGSIVLTVPDKRYYSLDRPRPLTTFDHFERDYRDGPSWSARGHFREVGEVWKKLSGDELDRYVEGSIASDTHAHFHVWDAESFMTFLLRAKQVLAIDYEIVEFAAYGHEALAVLKVAK